MHDYHWQDMLHKHGIYCCARKGVGGSSPVFSNDMTWPGFNVLRRLNPYLQILISLEENTWKKHVSKWYFKPKNFEIKTYPAKTHLIRRNALPTHETTIWENVNRNGL